MAKQAAVSTVQRSISAQRPAVGAGRSGGNSTPSKTAMFGGLGRTARSVAGATKGVAGPTNIPTDRARRAGKQGGGSGRG